MAHTRLGIHVTLFRCFRRGPPPLRGRNLWKYYYMKGQSHNSAVETVGSLQAEKWIAGDRQMLQSLSQAIRMRALPELLLHRFVFQILQFSLLKPRRT